MSEMTTPLVRLARLTIREYRTVAPMTTLRFTPGLTVILGQNASGKTTLLNLASMAVRSDFTELEDEDYDLEYEVSFPDGMLTAHVTNRLTEPEVPPSSAGSQPDRSAVPPKRRHVRTYSYAFTFQSPPSSVEITGDSARAVARIDGRERAVPPIQATSAGPMLTLWSIWEQKDRHQFPFVMFSPENYRFDESLEVFTAMTGERPPSGGACPPRTSLSIQLRKTADNHFILGAAPSFLPSCITRAIYDQHDKVTEIKNRIRLDESKLPFLAQLRDLLGLDGAEWRSEASERTVKAEFTDVKFDRFTFGLRKRDGSYATQDILSYGQKRLLAFLYYLDASSPGPIIADELVNGMHHVWIEKCLELVRLSDRQAIFTSQNPLLLDYLTFESSQLLRDTFILCHTDQGSKQSVMTWTQMDADEAEEFFSEYQQGIEHVGEILKRRGLW